MTTTTTTTPPTSTKSAVATAGSSILASLGAGSGIDTTSLVTNLVTATFSNRESTLQGKQTANTAQISAAGTLTSGISSFATALNTLVAGGTLKSQPSSSNTSVLTVKATDSAKLANLSANLEVRQLAQAQTLVSAPLATTSTAVGLGSLKLTTPTGAVDITITAANNSLDGLAKAINDANTGTNPTGVSATIVSDSTGKRLVLKGASGAANAFSLVSDPADPADANLTRFAFDDPAVTGSTMTGAQLAQDAIIRMDGVDSKYTTNTVTDLIDGATLNLVTAQPGTTVSLGITRPTSAISQAVNDFVSAYNELESQITTASAAPTGNSDAGPLHGNPAVRELQRQLKTITSSKLTTLPDGPQTLAEIGVSTKQDGTLTVDSAKLAKALATYPDAVEAMFNPGQRSSDPNLQVSSAIGATKPGTYTVSNIVVGPPVGGKLGVIPNQTPFLPHPTDASGLIAMTNSIAPGLAIHVLGNVSSATITVDPGLTGVLQAISDDLLKNKSDTQKGALTALSDTLNAQTKSLTTAREKLTTQEGTYSDQLTKQFMAMQTAVASYKSIQSYMTQQIAAWSNKN